MSNAHDNAPVAAGPMQESYIVNEGKKRGSTRDVRPEAAHDKFYTVVRVHPGDALLTDNWHTNEVFDHASIPATITDYFLGNYTQRSKRELAANTFLDYLNQPAIRPDDQCPKFQND